MALRHGEKAAPRMPACPHRTHAAQHGGRAQHRFAPRVSPTLCATLHLCNLCVERNADAAAHRRTRRHLARRPCCARRECRSSAASHTRSVRVLMLDLEHILIFKGIHQRFAHPAARPRKAHVVSQSRSAPPPRSPPRSPAASLPRAPRTTSHAQFRVRSPRRSALCPTHPTPSSASLPRLRLCAA
jgi:hypothetical protein